jgi:hypothetical protein
MYIIDMCEIFNLNIFFLIKKLLPDYTRLDMIPNEINR